MKKSAPTSSISKSTTPRLTTTVFLSVIVPAYNESRNLKKGHIKTLFSYLENSKLNYEIIFVDDGSTDNTLAQLQKLANIHPHTTVISRPHAGKAQTITAGMTTASGQWRLFTDFDQSTPISEVQKLLYAVKMDPKLKIAFGSREGEGERQDEPWYRHFMGRVFNWLVKLIAVPGVEDTQCGFKMFSAESALELFPALYVYGLDKGKKTSFTGAFDVELLYIARKRHLKYQEIPVKWVHRPASLIDRLRDSISMFFDLFKIRWADLRGKYDKK